MGIIASPDYVQTSMAGAMCLGLQRGKFTRNARCGCLNLLLTYPEGCSAACSYCGLACNRQADNEKTFIRVKWPTYPLAEILERMKDHPHPFRRVCVSMTTRPQALADTCTIMTDVKRETGLPISGLISPTVLKGKPDLERLKGAGADRIGIAIDAATPELFDRHRGSGVKGPHRWDRYWQCLKKAVEVFGPYRVGIHMIVGLGETEREMVEVIEKAYEMGALTHLFSFFPEDGSIMAGVHQPALGHYRRIQLARYLINEQIIPTGVIAYSPEGKIIDYRVDITPQIMEGYAFMTSGCPGEDGKLACNRPYGNERASEPMRNYPFVPQSEDVEIIQHQIWEGSQSYARG